MLNKRQTGKMENIESALWSFADSPEGKGYFAKYKLDGYRKLKPKELDAMEPYAQELRQSLR
jgi:phosphonate transport system substrate-binding protein